MVLGKWVGFGYVVEVVRWLVMLSVWMAVVDGWERKESGVEVWGDLLVYVENRGRCNQESRIRLFRTDHPNKSQARQDFDPQRLPHHT